MADYYPLLSRAIAGLADQPDVSRDAIYDRARHALERQLRGFEPALEEEAIRAEMAALEETIRRIEAENAPTATADDDDGLPGDDTPAPPAEPMLRPRMPERAENPARKRSLALFAGVAVVAMLVMGLIAISKRDVAQAPVSPPVVKAPPAGSDSSKTEGRLSGSEPGAGNSAPVSSPPLNSTSAGAESSGAESSGATSAPPAPPAGGEPKATPGAPEAPQKTPLPSEGRAFMVLEAQGSAPSQFEGKVRWAFAPDALIKGQNALKALIAFDAAGLSVDFSIARNSDASLNASHTVMVIFEPKNGIGNVREMSAVEWRERESQSGTTLAGIVVPVQDNIFMIGLDKTDAARQRNLALLQTQKWMVFEVRLESGRRGAILVEKGVNGEKAVADALAAWK